MLDEIKNVVITGAGSGIGRATALASAQRGAAVALLDLNEVALSKVCEEITSQFDTPVLSLTCDLADHAQLEQQVKNVVSEWGSIHAVCHCAAKQQFGRLEDFSVADFQNIVDINLVASFALSKLLVPALLKTGGSLVHIASLAGSLGLPYDSAYSASKAGLIMLVKSLAKEFSDREIKINAIAPGAVDTPMLAMAAPDNVNPAVLGLIPRSAKKPADPSEIANLATYLMFDAPASMTGSIISLAGASN